MFLVGLG
jgi:hypothetical protein